jgi:hypothetical protein
MNPLLQERDRRTKKEVWDFARRIPNAQDFIREIAKQFPVETIMLSDRGNIVIYREAK